MEAWSKGSETPTGSFQAYSEADSAVDSPFPNWGTSQMDPRSTPPRSMASILDGDDTEVEDWTGMVGTTGVTSGEIQDDQAALGYVEDLEGEETLPPLPKEEAIDPDMDAVLSTMDDPQAQDAQEAA
jgi:hypothetical protein